MKLNDLLQKFANFLKDGGIIKLSLVLAILVLSFFPFYSVMQKLYREYKNQPSVMIVIGSSILIILLILVLSVVLSRKKLNNRR